LKEKGKKQNLTQILVATLDGRHGRIYYEKLGRGYSYRVSADSIFNTVFLYFNLDIQKEKRNLKIRIKVHPDEKESHVVILEDSDFFDLLHNYLLDNRHELLEYLLHLMYVKTPPQTVFFLPLSEQAKMAVNEDREQDSSLLSIRRIAKTAGFPQELLRYEKIIDGHFLRCQKASN
jgi:hypothetical protein